MFAVRQILRGRCRVVVVLASIFRAIFSALAVGAMLCILCVEPSKFAALSCVVSVSDRGEK